jgi:hypothetical protein
VTPVGVCVPAVAADCTSCQHASTVGEGRLLAGGRQAAAGQDDRTEQQSEKVVVTACDI